jgi:acetyl esterase
MLSALLPESRSGGDVRRPQYRIVTVLAAVAVAIALTGAPSPRSGAVRLDPVAARSSGTAPPQGWTPNSTIPTSTSTVTVTPGVPYYEDGPTLDVYAPNPPGTSRPAIVMVHSGGWSSGSSAEFAPWAMQAADQLGWVAFSMDYRLDGNDPTAFPDELHDVQAAIRWVAVNAERYGADPDKIVLLGGSAGGNLVTLVSSIGTANPLTGSAIGVDPSAEVKVRAVAAWSPPVDLAPLVPAGPGEPPPGCGDDQACEFVWDAPDVVDYLGCEPAACPDTYKNASPISWVSSSTAPTFIANSSDELVPLNQIQQYLAALRAAGVTTHFDGVPGSMHSTQYGDQVWDATVSFLAGYVDPARSSAGVAAADSGSRSWLLAGGAVLVIVLALAGLRHRRTRHRARSA